VRPEVLESKLDGGGPICVQALEDGDIDVARRNTANSVIPDNGDAHRRQGPA
jgi:hypothetical protein